MLNIAMIPDSKQYFNNQILDTSEALISLKKSLMELGCSINTIDKYKNINSCDAFLFWNGINSANYEWYLKIIKYHLENKCIYWMLEPEAVIRTHTKEGLKQIKKYFSLIITWNTDLVDNVRVFHINFLQNLYPVFKRDINSFRSCKLLTNISGCKVSKCVDELYSERLKVIQYFEKMPGNDFIFFGIGWDKEKYKNYGGEVVSKEETYQKFKFALSLENQKNVKGYVSEKIIDCLKAGIIPIYQGASDITDYIPQDCFIPYDEFESIDDLIIFLKKLTDSQIENYLNSIYNFMNSDKIKIFSGEFVALQIYNVVNNLSENKFKLLVKDFIFLKINILMRKAKNFIKKIFV